MGLSGDIPLVGDIDGDDKADLIVRRVSTDTWFWLTSTTGYAASGSQQWGLTGDIPPSGSPGMRKLNSD